MKNYTQKLIGLFALLFVISLTVKAQDPPTEEETADHYLNLPEGWSMFGFTCINSVDAILGFSNIADKIEIVKDEWGLSYIPSWEFNAMGSLQYSEGYQIKMKEEVTNFQFCTIAGGVSQEEFDAAIAQVHAMYEGWCESDIDNDGICDIDEISGCMDNTACNFVLEAEFDDSSCQYSTEGFNCDGSCSEDIDQDGVCDIFEVLGCTDSIADNYNPIATEDDGSCFNTYCESELVILSGLLSLGAEYNNAYNYSIINSNGETLYDFYLSPYEWEYISLSDSFCLDPGCYYFNVSGESISASLLQDGELLINLENNFNPELFGANVYNLSSEFCVGTNFGCTDTSALNYDIEATFNVGCILPVYGCTDPDHWNYNHLANTDDNSCFDVYEACPYDEYLEYHPNAMQYNVGMCWTIIVLGCTDYTALNYNYDANLDDNSCNYIYGCTDSNADNYDSDATTSDSSCIYLGCTNPTSGNYNETANVDDGSCLIGGCMNYIAENYNPNAEIDNGTCIVYGCTLSAFPNYNYSATADDGSCDMNSLNVYGCTDASNIAFKEQANTDDGSCYYGPTPKVGDIIAGGIVFEINDNGSGLIADMSDLGSMNHGNALNAANNSLRSGYNNWRVPSIEEVELMYNMIGNGGQLGNIGGFVATYYWAAGTYWNGQYAFEFHFGVGLSTSNNAGDSNYVRAVRDFGNPYNCMDISACNYNALASFDEGSCDFPEQGYDCEENIDVQVGDEAFGGIIFYVDETGEHGLVAAMEDLPGTYQWGCYGVEIDGADGQTIGTGYQNTLDILAVCSETPIAASVSLEYESEGYSDWYLPSLNELEKMYNNLSLLSSNGEVYGFQDSWYWSSSEYYHPSCCFGTGALPVSFQIGPVGSYGKEELGLVRPIRSF